MFRLRLEGEKDVRIPSKQIILNPITIVSNFNIYNPFNLYNLNHKLFSITY